MRFGLETFRDDPCADRTVFPAQSSVLDEEALLHRVASKYEIPAPVACRFFCRGWADVYRVRTAGPTFYLKVYRPPHPSDRTETEARLVADLHNLGAPVAPAVKRRDGRFACEVLAPEGPRPILLFEAAPPTPLPKTLDAVVCRALGTGVARLHEAMDALPQRYPLPAIDAASIFCELMPYAQARMLPSDIARLDRIVQQARPMLARLPTQSPDFGLCHSDLATVNLRLADDGRVTFFDFAEAKYSWRAIDLKRLHDAVQRHTPAEAAAPVWDALLAAYASVRPVPAGLHESLPLLKLAGLIQMLLYATTCCPLRMGEENFGQESITKDLAEIENLAADIPEMR